MADALLAGLKVIELAGGIAGWSAGLYLSEAGAEVLKIEPPAGDPARASAPFRVLNRGKRSAVLDLSTEAGRAQLQGLLAGADVLIHDYPPSVATTLGLACLLYTSDAADE